MNRTTLYHAPAFQVSESVCVPCWILIRQVQWWLRSFQTNHEPSLYCAVYLMCEQLDKEKNDVCYVSQLPVTIANTCDDQFIKRKGSFWLAVLEVE